MWGGSGKKRVTRKTVTSAAARGHGGNGTITRLYVTCTKVRRTDAHISETDRLTDRHNRPRQTDEQAYKWTFRKTGKQTE